jgi:hypothetical protein
MSILVIFTVGTKLWKAEYILSFMKILSLSLSLSKRANPGEATTHAEA